MATRSLIGKTEGIGDFKVTYCHLDGYPTGMGKTLWDNVQKYGQERVLHRLMDEFDATWSSIVGTDFFEKEPENLREIDVLAPYEEDGPMQYNPDIGSISRNREDVEKGRHMGAEYMYLFSPSGAMTVIKVGWEGELDMLAMIDLSGEEPDWEKIEAGEYATEKETA